MLRKISSVVVIVLIAFVVLAISANRLLPGPTAKALRDLSRSAAGLQISTLQVGALSIPYLEGGSGEPLILVHGFTANKDTFNDVARDLSKHYRVISLDLPGFGEATKDLSLDYRIVAQMEVVRAFMRAKGLSHAHFGGSSMGGGIVAAMALQYPQEVDSLWLLDAAATREAREMNLLKSFDLTGNFPLLTRNMEEVEAKLEILFGQPKFIPYCIQYAFNEAGIRDYELHKQILSRLRDAPLVEDLPPVQVPTLIVFGELDRVIPPRSADSLAKVFPNNQIKIMEGVGHIPMAEVPCQTAHDYLVFRETLVRKSSPKSS